MKITEVPLSHPDALQLQSELSQTLRTLTGNTGQASFTTKSQQEETHFFLAIEENRLIGCFALCQHSAEIAELKRFYCRFPRQGYGTKLLQLALVEARYKGFSVLRLETRRINQAAVTFYQKQGFQKIANYPPYTNRGDAICLARKLVQEA